MLTLFRRHSVAKCQHKSRTWRRCSCPLWVDGSLEGKRYHKALKIRNWEKAQEIVRKLETQGEDAKQVTIEAATDAFLRDAQARELRESSIYKYRLLFKQLKAFADDKGIRFISECDVETLRRFRESWLNKNYSARKKLESLRTFFRFVHDSGWLTTNPAAVIKPPKVDDPPTLPFTRDDFRVF